jgi:hypothetical protein
MLDAAVPNIESDATADRELTWLCNRLVALRDTEVAAVKRNEDVDQDVDTEWWSVARRIESLGAPMTLDGAKAMAKAAAAHMYHHPNGKLEILTIAEYLSAHIVEFLSGRTVA